MILELEENKATFFKCYEPSIYLWRDIYQKLLLLGDLFLTLKFTCNVKYLTKALILLTIEPRPWFMNNSGFCIHVN